jgi:hypothetical protein
MSPLLFVAGMEVITAIMAKAVEAQLLRDLARITPLQRLSLFADDVVCFFRPDREEIHAIKEILNIFGVALGLKVNYRKTTATLIRGSEEDKERVIEILGYEVAEFPIKYLGLQLALRPLTKAEWQPLLDKALHFVPAWMRSMIGREGRLTLIKAVLTFRTIHQLLIADAPVWLLEELNRGFRAFFWAGKKAVHGGQCLVAWDVICSPTRFGGLGIKDLRLQGIALRTRWQWLRRTDPERPWQGLLHLKDEAAEGVFQTLARIEVGDGKSVLFWRDRWINGFTAAEIAPLISEMVPTRRKNARKVSDALPNSAWIKDLAGLMSIEGCIQCVRLWEAIDQVDRNELIPDRLEQSQGCTRRKTPTTCCVKGASRTARTSKSGKPLRH